MSGIAFALQILGPGGHKSMHRSGCNGQGHCRIDLPWEGAICDGLMSEDRLQLYDINCL